jgi:hypothetical protein
MRKIGLIFDCDSYLPLMKQTAKAGKWQARKL